uniref:Prolactin-induced protein n=1 Tax=Castor canadensis TaxID=51338 RepID=A0A8C0ZS51_CASCN
MCALQPLCKPSSATLLLVFCLRLGTSIAQEDGEEIISLNMTTSKSDKPNEFWLKLTVTNNVNECMVVKISTEDNPSVQYPNGHVVYTACICDINNYYWEIAVSGNADIVGTAEVVSTQNICPDGEKLYPAIGYQVFATITVKAAA